VFSVGWNNVGNPLLAMPLKPLSILFLQLRLTQNVFPLMRFLILETAKSHTGVVTLAFDFWPETAKQIRHYEH